MRFSCSTTDLNGSLAIVSHALAVRSPKPVLEGILFESCDEGLRLTSTDMALGIETVIPASFSEEGRIVLPGRLLCEVVRKLPNGTADISVNDRMQATLRCMGSRTTIKGFDPMEYPELPTVTGPFFSMEQSQLHNMIEKTSFAIATDESRPILTGCLMEIAADEIRMVALDGFRLALRKESIQGPQTEIKAVVGGKVLSDISRILSDSEEPATLCFSRTHMALDIGPTHIVARLLEGEFIHYRQILPESWKTLVTVSRTELGSAIERASLIAREGKSNLVCLKIDGEQMSITSNSDSGDVEEHIGISTQGEALNIAFNVKYMTDVLKSFADDEILMRFNSSISPCVVCPTDSDNALYLVLPVRVFGI